MTENKIFIYRNVLNADIAEVLHRHLLEFNISNPCNNNDKNCNFVRCAFRFGIHHDYVDTIEHNEKKITKNDKKKVIQDQDKSKKENDFYIKENGKHLSANVSLYNAKAINGQENIYKEKTNQFVKNKSKHNDNNINYAFEIFFV